MALFGPCAMSDLSPVRALGIADSSACGKLLRVLPLIMTSVTSLAAPCKVQPVKLACRRRTPSAGRPFGDLRQGVRKRAPGFHCRADDFLLQRECVTLHFVRKRVGSSHHKPASINPYAELGAFRAAACYVLSPAGTTILSRRERVFGGNVREGPCRQCWLIQENCDASHQVPQNKHQP
jgi:hypothetical protein